MVDADSGADVGAPVNTSDEPYDLLVIGGGVNGLATAWDAASRGVKVLIVDKGDWGSGTSSWSSRLVHGGLKYLEHLEFGLVYESLRDREWLLRRAPHLVKPLPFLMPFYRTNQHNRWILRLGMLIYDVLSVGKSVPNHRALSRAETIALAPGLRADGLQGAGRYYDAQVEFAERLCVELLLAAERAGATARNHTAATSLVREGDRVVGAVLVDAESGREQTVRARVVVNAAGPWIDDVLADSPMGRERLNGGTKGTHLVVRRFPGGPVTDCVYYEARSDGRQVLVIPWDGRYLIGSTDKRFSGDLDRAQPDQQEVDYILAETNLAFPGAHLSQDDVEYAYTGVRPLPYVPTGDVGKITRKHIIHSHAPSHPGLLTVIGGKLTTFRTLGEHAADRALRALGKRGRSTTRSAELPGGGDLAAAHLELARILPDLTAPARERLVSLYGSRCVDVARSAVSGGDTAQLGATLALRAEVVFGIRFEHAVRLQDVLARRTMLGLDGDLGLGVLDEVVELMGDELDWSVERRRREASEYRIYIERFTRTEEGRSVGATSPRH